MKLGDEALKLAEERAKYFLSEDHVTIQIISDLENDVEKVRKILEIIASYVAFEVIFLFTKLPSPGDNKGTFQTFN